MSTFRLLIFFLLLASGLHQLQAQTYFEALADSAFVLTNDRVIYDPAYFSIDYPMGDVPRGKGVCTDVVIRAYRKMGTDLQVLVHEDMKNNFNVYPRNWGLRRPDKNIDHRRVPNLMTFFKRQGAQQPISSSARDYKAGDVVSWDLGGGITHIGLVSDIPSPSDSNRKQIIHNIGAGQVLEDCLFRFRIIGHYRFRPD